MRRDVRIALTVGIVLPALGLGLSPRTQGSEDLRRMPRVAVTAGTAPARPDTEVGSGASEADSPHAAVAAAVTQALAGKRRSDPDFGIVFATSPTGLRTILAETRKRLGPRTKLYGGTTDLRVLMSDDRLAPGQGGTSRRRSPHAVRLVTVSSAAMDFGVGAADYREHPTVQAAAMAAVREALDGAERSPAERPALVVVIATPGTEESALEGIDRSVGAPTVVLSSTAAGSDPGVIGEDEAVDAGVAVAVVFTRRTADLAALAGALHRALTAAR
jgi:hypothetical protein